MVGNLSSEERVKMALEHKEPEKVPFDLGSTTCTGITACAYKRLLTYLNLNKNDMTIIDPIQQLVEVDEDILEMLKVDTRGLIPATLSGGKEPEITEDSSYKYLIDVWGIEWRMPKAKGYYYDIYKHPLKGEIDKKRIDSYPFPSATDLLRTTGLKEKAEKFKDKAIVIGPPGGGCFDLGFFMRGFQDFYMDLAIDPSVACYLMDKFLEIRLAYWDIIFKELGDYILVVLECDDLGQQNGTVISPEMYRKYVKPREKRVLSYIKKIAPRPVYILFHTDGSVYDIIPDLIEIGVDALNPVQVSAAKMDAAKLKKEFGKELTFWGGGIDTQCTLPYGTPAQIRDEVKRRIEDFAPGGGFVFTPVHNIQPDVPPKNILAMWEALQEYGVY